jgi:hypothetical protein
VLLDIALVAKMANLPAVIIALSVSHVSYLWKLHIFQLISNILCIDFFLGTVHFLGPDLDVLVDVS